MTQPDPPRHVEVSDGTRTVADAEVTADPEGTARASLRAASGQVPPGHRASLVDAVLDTPEVRASSRLEVAVPLGDSESLDRLRERTEDVSTRPAGSTALVDATIPPPDSQELGQPG